MGVPEELQPIVDRIRRENAVARVRLAELHEGAYHTAVSLAGGTPKFPKILGKRYKSDKCGDSFVR